VVNRVFQETKDKYPFISAAGIFWIPPSELVEGNTGKYFIVGPPLQKFGFDVFSVECTDFDATTYYEKHTGIAIAGDVRQEGAHAEFVSSTIDELH
jgi:hypothetical protein